MKKLFLLSVVAVVPMLASLDASAMTVEARGFALCTTGHNASGLCNAGSFFSGRADAHPGHPAATLVEETTFFPDWGTTNAERWKPGGTTSVTGSTGVNWTCCVELGASESWANVTTTFQVWAIPGGSTYTWVNAEWSGFIGWDDDTYSWCANSDAAVFQGKTDSGTPSNYTSNMRIARCKATYSYPPIAPPYWHGIEYWMD